MEVASCSNRLGAEPQNPSARVIFTSRRSLGPTKRAPATRLRVVSAIEKRTDQSSDSSNPTKEQSSKLSTLANSLLMNAASLLRPERKTAYCIACHGDGICQCPLCQGTGIVKPEKVAKMNSIRHAVHKLSSIVNKDAANMYDSDWMKTNRCNKCKGTGRVVCSVCGGTGRRFSGG